MGHVIGAWFERDVVAVTGKDAAGFLQGQLSQDVAALPVGGSAWSLLLQPTGRLVAIEADGVRAPLGSTSETSFDLDPGAAWECIEVSATDLRTTESTQVCRDGGGS